MDVLTLEGRGPMFLLNYAKHSPMNAASHLRLQKSCILCLLEYFIVIFMKVKYDTLKGFDFVSLIDRKIHQNIPSLS